MKFQEIMLKYCVKLCIEQSFYQCIFQTPYREGSRRKYKSWLPLNEISGNYTDKSFKTIYITGIIILGFEAQLFPGLTKKECNKTYQYIV